jgi:hypothetical protein
MARGIIPPHASVVVLAPWARAACHGPRTSRSRGDVVRGGDLSCEAETSWGVPLVGNWSEMLPTGRRLDVLQVWILTGSSVLLVLNLGLDTVNLGLHVVNGVGLPYV